ncbi:hypothetical protein CEUSTIGMA_g11635.t1 [Chlamydomonas eustigma]|uniref:Uncharacterized protein n=1 Tax=Chlamydomonas eustigma TaxID=1157962 RepID=A0A250XMT1_9CHLO|nr:hypothetical protein CEUSTIGMA_g11635.t1 [Chlamydomonas eustigma]|eukprot:GAX84212.1 hypothetical protein CEUSTIGMA_g11635.t1 [Chlamydomonas eustigma]
MKWEILSQNGSVPVARSSHSVTHVSNANSLYLFGGEHDPRTPISNEFYAYNLESANWEIIQAAGLRPEPRVAHTAAVVQDSSSIYIFGGRSGKEMGEGAFDDLHLFDTSTSMWSLVTDEKGTPPPKRSFHTAAVAGSSMYIFGGCGAEGRLADLHQFDTKANQWHQLPEHDSIKGRGGSCLIASSDQRSLFLLGGFCGHELADMYCFDLVAGKWREVTGLPFARSVFGAAAHCCTSTACDLHGAVIVFGGEVDPSDKGHEGAGDFCSDLTYLPQGSEAVWTSVDLSSASMAQRPSARGWYAYTSVNGNLLIHGGLDCKNERLGDMYLFNCS